MIIFDNQFESLSVDIFDTLLFRMCSDPNEIFELMVDMHSSFARDGEIFSF
jgi:hypothetical protein